MEQAQCKPYQFLHVLVVNWLVDFFLQEGKGVISQLLLFFSVALQTGIVFNAIRVAVGFYLLVSGTFSRNQGIKKMLIHFFSLQILPDSELGTCTLKIGQKKVLVESEA